jgi:hypothetical protein
MMLTHRALPFKNSLRSIVAITVSALSLGAAATVHGQSMTGVRVNGTVVDAGTGAPIAGAVLTLAGAGRAVLPPAGASPRLTDSRSTMSDSLGRYELRGIVSGRYQLMVKRLGYQPSVVDVDITEGVGSAQLSVGLVVVPVRLQPVSIYSNELNLFGTASPSDSDMMVAPVEAARARQSRFLATDVRELTATGALEGGALGETDIFRALRRMPGVTGVNDQTTELWVRGAQWDQVRVSYDGLPLFNPFHAYGSMTGVSSDAIGAAFLHPGVRPVSLLGQGASLVDIRSRAPTDTSLRVVTEASGDEVAAGLEKARKDGRSGISVVGRTSLGDAILVGRHDAWPAKSYAELAVRANQDLGDGKSIELSDLMSRDYPRAFSDLSWFYGPRGSADRPSPDILRSGTHLGRATLNFGAGHFRLSQTIGFSAYEGRDYSIEYPPGAYDSTEIDYFIEPGKSVPYFSRVSFTTLRGTMEPANGSSRWTLGYEFGTYRASSTAPRHAYSWSDLSTETLQLSRTLSLPAIWGDRRWNPSESLTIDGGLRVEGAGERGVRLAPSLLARRRLGSVTSASLGISRTFQDAQELPFSRSAVNGLGRGFWLLTSKDIAALVADQASAGVERWIGGSILVDANAYGRRLSRVAVRPLPTGDSIPGSMFRESTIDAYGFEVGARKLTGRVTGSFGYTYGKATQRIGAETFTAPGDRSHSVDATAMLHVSRLRFGTALTAMTGAPYTRMVSGFGRFVPPDTVRWANLWSAEDRNAQRMPGYFKVDAFAELTASIRGIHLTPFIGLTNVTNHDNLTTYIPMVVVNGRPNPYAQPNGDYLIDLSGGRSLSGGVRIVF